MSDSVFPVPRTNTDPTNKPVTLASALGMTEEQSAEHAQKMRDVMAAIDENERQAAVSSNNVKLDGLSMKCALHNPDAAPEAIRTEYVNGYPAPLCAQCAPFDLEQLKARIGPTTLSTATMWRLEFDAMVAEIESLRAQLAAVTTEKDALATTITTMTSRDHTECDGNRGDGSHTP